MNIYSNLFLATVAADVAIASNNFVPEPHRYFTRQIRDAADRANNITSMAIPYPGRYPSIDISSWLEPPSATNKQERQDVVYQVLEQAIGAGSFNIIGHNVTYDLLSHLESSTAKFFSQSLDFKRQFSSDHPKAGYVENQKERYGATIYKSDNPLEREGDMREIFSMMYPPTLDENVQAPKYFQSVMNEFLQGLNPLSIALTQIFSAALSQAKGVELPSNYLGDEDMAGGTLRVFRYPTMPTEYSSALKLVPHHDFGSLTFIYGSEEGLEEIRDGRWVQVPINPLKGEIHVTVGELYAMWSNGLFNANIHRVSQDCAADRISYAYFTGQGHKMSDEEKEPVCTQQELPRFPKRSATSHTLDYIASQKSGESYA